MKTARFYKFKEAIEKDLVIQADKIDDFCLSLPGKKHFWVGKLIQEKIHLKELESKKKQLEKAAFDNIPLEGARKVTRKSLVLADPEIASLQEDIEESQLILEYLDKVEKVFAQTSYDLKNYNDSRKMELN